MSFATLEDIRAEIERRAALIGAASDWSLPTYGQSSDFARPHIEVDQRGYHFVVVERGRELKRKTSPDLDELLFEVFQSVTFSLACEYEVAHRVRGQDFRRLMFARQVELLSQLSPQWAQRRAEEHQQILGDHPFHDER